MKLESKRFKVIDSEISPGIMIYDMMLSKIVIDICTGNKQINEVIAWTSFQIIHSTEFLHKMMEMME